MKKRSDGLYRVSKVIDGKQKYFYGHSREEAYKKKSEYLKQAEIASVSFANIAEEWADNHFLTLAYNSRKGYKPAYRRAVEEFGDRDITSITPGDISLYIRDFARGRADKTVRTQLMVINLIFRYAINYCRINIPNPARDIEIPKGLRKNKVSVPSDEDIKKVKECADLPFGAFGLLLLYTGLRRGELLAITGEDIDIKNRTITVNKSLYYENNHPRIKAPKTEMGVRIVPILDAVLQTVKKLPKHGPIFTVRKGEYLTDHEFFREWNNYVQMTGIQCTPHQLRHAFATMLYENGVDPKTASFYLGHAQTSTTQNIYQDIRKSRMAEMNPQLYGMDI